jgi:hypothetical protein
MAMTQEPIKIENMSLRVVFEADSLKGLADAVAAKVAENLMFLLPFMRRLVRMEATHE